MQPLVPSHVPFAPFASSADATPGLRASPVRVAVVQFDPQVGVENLERNAQAVHERLTAAVRNKAQLIVLPELATTGYCFSGREEAYAHAQAVPGGASVQGWAEFAAQHGVYIVGCLVEQEGLQLFDTAVLVGPEGYIGRYRKTHPVEQREAVVHAGQRGLPGVRDEDRPHRPARVLGHLVSRGAAHPRAVGRGHPLHSDQLGVDPRRRCTTRAAPAWRRT
jgi:N-carbamoylputrescine amidase